MIPYAARLAMTGVLCLVVLAQVPGNDDGLERELAAQIPDMLASDIERLPPSIDRTASIIIDRELRNSLRIELHRFQGVVEKRRAHEQKQQSSEGSSCAS